MGLKIEQYNMNYNFEQANISSQVFVPILIITEYVLCS